MSANGRAWDVRLAKSGTKATPMMAINFPVALGNALRDAGYARATLILTAEGILVRPYKGEQRASKPREVLELPSEWPA